MAVLERVSPLDEFLAIAGTTRRRSHSGRRRKPGRANLAVRALAVAGIGAVAVSAMLGTTLADDVTIGTGQIEFGQGIATTHACTDSVTVDLPSTYNSGSSSFELSELVVSGINTVACGTKTFTARLFDGSDNLVVELPFVPNDQTPDGTGAYHFAVAPGIAVTTIQKIAVSTSD